MKKLLALVLLSRQRRRTTRARFDPRHRHRLIRSSGIRSERNDRQRRNERDVHRAESSDEVYYSAPTLAVGNYNVTVEKHRIQTYGPNAVSTLQVDQRAQVDVTLEVGTIAESVQVQAQAPLVDTGGASSARWSRTAA